MIIVKPTDDPLSIDYQAGAMIMIDKPIGWTSFDVVNKIRYRLKNHLQVKKIKVGHAGTLDPLATGLLILCTGKATKQIETFQNQVKKYSGCIKLGATTPSYDAEFEEENIKDTAHLSQSQVLDACYSFKGEIDQLPPNFSALKINGKASYKWARKGIVKELKSRKITFYDIQIPKIELPYAYFCVECSKGTYIRSFAHDVGQKLDVGAYLTELRRLSIGEYTIENAWNLDKWVDVFESKQE